jgi:hypothetical protein
MTHHHHLTTLRAGLLVSLAALSLFAAGCARKQEATSSGFATPEDAAKALVAALEKNDLAAAQQLLGPESAELLSSGDDVADQAARKNFVASYAAKNSVTVDGDTATLVVGPNDWSLPIPIVQRDGKWAFDGEKGVDEMIYRRVGANELGAIDVLYGYVTAQIEYASEGRDGDPAGIYALKLISDPGTACTGRRPRANRRARRARSSRARRRKGTQAVRAASPTTATTTGCSTRRDPTPTAAPGSISRTAY